MSYGPMHTSGNDDDHEDRGLLFMAYNADISEQFEVIQRWLTGGNSTGSTSGQSCPVLGVPENGFPRHFRFEHKANPDDDDDDTLHVVRVQLEENTPVFDDPKVLTQLEWGMYLTWGATISEGCRGRLGHRSRRKANSSLAASEPHHCRRGRTRLTVPRR